MLCFKNHLSNFSQTFCSSVCIYILYTLTNFHDNQAKDNRIIAHFSRIGRNIFLDHTQETKLQTSTRTRILKRYSNVITKVVNLKFCPPISGILVIKFSNHSFDNSGKNMAVPRAPQPKKGKKELALMGLNMTQVVRVLPKFDSVFPNFPCGLCKA